MYGPLTAPSRLEREGVQLAPADSAKRAPLAPGRRPHVCFVAPTTWPILSGDASIPVVGGAELQQKMLATGLARRGYRVSMICLDYGQPDRSVVDGVTVHRIYRPDEGIPVVRFVHPRLTKLWAALKRVDADIYYQRTAAANTGFVAAFCRRHGKRSIYAGASDTDFLPGRQDIRFARDRKIFEYGVRSVDRVIVQNPLQQQRVREHYGRGSVLIPNGFATPPGARAHPGGYVLWVATVRLQKRPEIVLEMARRMPRQRFVMIGGVDPEPTSQDMVRAIRDAADRLPNLEYKGFLPFEEADRYFDGARVVLNTSLYEGFPNTFLQAWSRGVPTLAFVDTGSRLGGEPVYDIVNDVSEATAKLERLMSDDAYWAEAGSRALAYFRENHSEDAILARYEAELEALQGAA